MTFTVYSKDGCPIAQGTKVLQLELSHVVYKLGTDYTVESSTMNSVGSTFPRVVVDDKILGGCQETVKYLRENKLVWDIMIDDESLDLNKTEEEEFKPSINKGVELLLRNKTEERITKTFKWSLVS